MVTVPLQLSVAVTAASLAAGTADEQLTVTLAGMLLMIGAVISFTVMVCDVVLLLPQASVAVHVLVIIKRLAQLPGAVTSFTVTVTAPEQLSAALTEVILATGTADAQL